MVPAPHVKSGSTATFCDSSGTQSSDKNIILTSAFKVKATSEFLISNFRLVLSVECFLLGNSPESEFYMPTFRNTLFHLHRHVGVKNELGLRDVGVFIRARAKLSPV